MANTPDLTPGQAQAFEAFKSCFPDGWDFGVEHHEPIQEVLSVQGNVATEGLSPAIRVNATFTNSSDGEKLGGCIVLSEAFSQRLSTSRASNNFMEIIATKFTDAVDEYLASKSKTLDLSEEKQDG